MAVVKHDILDLTISKVPMVKVLILYIIGIVGALVSSSFLSQLFSLGLMSIIIVLYFSLSYFKVFSQKYLFTVSFSLLVIIFGHFNYTSKGLQNASNFYKNYPASKYIGIIDDEPIYKEKTIRFPVRIIYAVDSSKSHQVVGKVMLTLLRDTSINLQNYHYGDKIAFLNKLKDVNPPFNPKEFDYKSYLENKGVYEQVLLQSSEIIVLDSDCGNRMIAYSLELRSKLIAKFRKYIKDDEAYNVAIALIFGYRSQIDQHTISAFTSTGTIHVLSVSGLHVSLVFALLNYVLFWMDRIRYGKFVKSIVILLAIWSYVVLTGMSPPILRAGIMISFFVFSIVLNRKQIPLNTLAASALFILLFAPNYLFDVGFQLSYLAILGIVLLYPILKSYYLTANKWLNYVLEYIYVSVSAQLFTLPLTLYYFGQFPNYFLIANLFIALPSTLIMYVGIGLALLPFEWTNHFFGMLVEWLLKFMMSGLKWIEFMPLALIQGIEWHWIQMLFLILVILGLVLGLNNRFAKSLLLVLVSLCLIFIYSTYISYRNSNYSGITVYNIRTDLAISSINENKVMLFSTFDSLNHSTLQYSVLPHLRYFATDGRIKYQSNSFEGRKNQILEIGNHRILILEKKIIDIPKELDFVIWRKNNYTDIQMLIDRNPKIKIILDGSNSDKSIERLKLALESNSERLYILKNNFAYVWNEE